jgi:chaperonin cofactor prefoldin
MHGGSKVFINIDNMSSDFAHDIDLQKQYTTIDSVEKDIRKQLDQLQKRITKSLKEWQCK